MAMGSELRLADVFVSIRDPRQAAKVEHDLVELPVIGVNAVLVGADTFVEIELWAKERLDWLRRYLNLENGIPSHDTFGRLFGLIDPDEFEAAFRRWVSAILPAVGADTVVAIDGKTSRRSGKVDATPLYLVSAFAAGAGQDWCSGNARRRRNRTRRRRFPNSSRRCPSRAVSSRSMRWERKPTSPKPSGIAVPITCWR